MAEVSVATKDPMTDALLSVEEQYCEWAALGFYDRLLANQELRRATGMRMDQWLRTARSGRWRAQELDGLVRYLKQLDAEARRSIADPALLGRRLLVLNQRRASLARGAEALRIAALHGAMAPWTSARKA